MINETQNDNWGASARIGMFIVGNEAVPEAEWWAMVPPSVSVHAARVTAAAPWASWNPERTVVKLTTDMQHGADQFANMRLSAVVVGHSSSSFIGGSGWDDAVIKQLSSTLGNDVFITTNGVDCLAALRACGIKRPLVVLPAWFGAGLVTASVEYLTQHGVMPAGTLSYDPGLKWSSVPVELMYSKGIGFEQELAPLYRQITGAFESPADGILVAGTGFRSVGIIEILENALHVPVVTANQASLWHCLRRTGCSGSVKGYGQLFEREQ